MNYFSLGNVILSNITIYILRFYFSDHGIGVASVFTNIFENQTSFRYNGYSQFKIINHLRLMPCQKLKMNCISRIFGGFFASLLWTTLYKKTCLIVISGAIPQFTSLLIWCMSMLMIWTSMVWKSVPECACKRHHSL